MKEMSEMASGGNLGEKGCRRFQRRVGEAALRKEKGWGEKRRATPPPQGEGKKNARFVGAGAAKTKKGLK